MPLGARRCLHVRNLRGARYVTDRTAYVGAGQNLHHSRRGPRLGHIHGTNPRVRVRATMKRDVQQSGQNDVVHIVGQTLDKPRVFFPL